ncbi:hypothetical protein TCE0_041r13927 [Talaromyces pinophilus]|uniref:Uncharacterized protein n=1 Tax=Talaromyces pinophilus TaxID=128442 RepID=A0A6V8HIF4_TALPI|nr:hypothetical protein TCE0_041r13927 [Talaromyces pinophilus]
MRITLMKIIDANIFGTPAYLKSRHADLQQKWVTHNEKVEELWRFFTPSQREAVFRAGVKQGRVPKDAKDRSMFRSYALYPEMNVRDIAGSPDFFLDHFEFRAATGLMHQYRNGLKGTKGDHQVVTESMVVNEVRSVQDCRNELMFFMDEDKYGDIYEAKDEEDYKKVFYELKSIVKTGIVVPRSVGELILERQCYLFQHLCVLVDNILQLGAIIDNGVKEYMTPEEEARIAFSAYPTDEKPQSICVQDLITVAVDRKVSFEAYWDLCRSNPDFLANEVSLWYSTRPDLVPDEQGRRMPLASNEHVSRSIFEVIHNAVIGIAIWDILSALFQVFIEPSDDLEQDIILQEISNICHYEYDRVRKGFKRFAQIGSGSKHFKRLAKVFDNGTPRVVLKSIPDRVIKENPQLHYILRLCQPELGAAQAVQWNNMLASLHHNHPLEQDKLEEWEFGALGEISLTINLVNTAIESLELPSASPKKGLTYISKLKELISRLEPLKTHTNLRRLPISLDDIKDPNTAKEASSIVDRFCEYYAGGSMVALYQNLNKEFLEDLEVQLQEAKGMKKMKTKHSSKSAGADRSTTQRQGTQADKAHSSDPSLASLSRKLASFLKTKAKVSAGYLVTTGLEKFVNAESSAQPESSTEPRPEMSSQASPFAESETSPQVDASVGVGASKFSTTAASESSASSGPSARQVTPTESEAEEIEQKPVEEPELSADAQLQPDLAKSTEATTAEDELFIGPNPYTQFSTSTVMEVLAELALSEPRPAGEPEISAESGAHTEPGPTGAELAMVSEENVEMAAPEPELRTEADPSVEVKVPEGLGESGSGPFAENTEPESSQEADIPPESGSRPEAEVSTSEDTNKLGSEAPAEPEASTMVDTAEEATAAASKVSPSALQVFTTIFSALEKSESNSGSQPGPEHSIKWFEFGAAMKEIGFSILPSLGALYSFVPGVDSDVATFFTLHRPYRSVIRGDGLLLLALRLKLLYGWGKDSFEAE